MLAVLDASVVTALSKGFVTFPPAELLVKISISGPPTTPTPKVPVAADADMATPLVTPGAFNGVTPGPTAVCCCAKLAGDQVTIARLRAETKDIFFMKSPMEAMHNLHDKHTQPRGTPNGARTVWDSNRGSPATSVQN